MYDRHRPFFASIKEKQLLNKPGSQKQTYHLVLNIEGFGLKYQVGDSVAVLPSHDPDLVERTLLAAKLLGEESICDPRTQELRTVRSHLAHKANITRLNKTVIEKLAEYEPDAVEKEFLCGLLQEGKKEELNGYLKSFELWDLLQAHPNVTMTAQELVDLLPPVLPRFYSIASSAEAVGEEIHLTVASSNFISGGIERKGVGTHFLCQMTPLHQPVVPIYIQPSNGFTVPSSDHLPIIMVGPGTGVAPFRAFMQERVARGAAGKNWLFFGEWHQEYDFFYEEFWRELEEKKHLKLHYAFSRDQSEKIYVQHRMMECAEELWSWLQEGAHFYVCGDAERMAKEVDQTLHQIVATHGKFSEEQTKAYIKNLRREKRYLKDVY